MRTSLKCLFAALISGIIGISLWAPFDKTDAVWFVLVPLLFVIRRFSPKIAFFTGWLAGAIQGCGSLAWMSVLTDNGGPLILVWLGIFGLGTYLGLYWGIFAFAATKFREKFVTPDNFTMRILTVLLIEPVLWAGCEYLRCNLMTGFAWNPLGLGFSGFLPLLQSAAIGGAYMVSALVVMSNGAICSIFERCLDAFFRRQNAVSRMKRILSGMESVIPMMILAVAFYAGMRHIVHMNQISANAPKVSIVSFQTDNPSVFVSNRNIVNQLKSLQSYSELTGLLAVAPDLIIWPESALHGALPIDSQFDLFMQDCVKRAKAPILTGGTYLPTEKTMYNAAMLFNEKGLMKPVYAKRHLVPFGEYIPFDKTFTSLQKLVPSGGSCTPGKDVKTLDIPTKNDAKTFFKIAPLICFEGTVANETRQSVLSGANLLVNISNDSWYKFSSEAVQHARQSIFRCIESATAMVRSTNSGMNCAISATGSIENMSELNKDKYHNEGFRPYQVALKDSTFLTPYMRFGDWIFAIPSAISLCLVILLSFFKLFVFRTKMPE